jgi:hypothetical protein
MCMGGPKPITPPPAPPPEAPKVLTTPEVSSNSVTGSRNAGAAKRGLRVDIGGGTSGTGLNLPV